MQFDIEFKGCYNLLFTIQFSQPNNPIAFSEIGMQRQSHRYAQ